MTVEEHRRFLETDFDDVDLEQMEDICKISIDTSLPQEKRQEKYLSKVKNPYLIRVGNMKVKLRFADNGVSFEEAFERMLMNA